MKKIVRNFHKVFKYFIRIPASWYLHGKIGWVQPKLTRLPRKEGAIILCNHQTDYDPVMITTAFTRPIYFVCADSVFSKPGLTRMMDACFGTIPKKKGVVDSSAVRGILQVIKKKQVVGIFPEGNRSMAEFQFEIDSSIAKLVKKCNVNLILYNLHGGNAVYPRFAKEARKGRITGEIKAILTPAQYNEMSDEELTQYIIDNLRVYDSINGEKCISDRPAEYLERLLFVCPRCHHLHTLETKGNKIKCNHCGLEATYDETLHFSSNDKDFKYNLLNEWFQDQKEFMKTYDYPKNGEIIFEDDDVDLKLANPFQKRVVLSHGKVTLTDKKLKIEDYEFDIHDITSASVFSGNRVSFTAGENSYLIWGHDRFNALKYVYMFNLLDTQMKENKTDHYYNLN